MSSQDKNIIPSITDYFIVFLRSIKLWLSSLKFEKLKRKCKCLIRSRKLRPDIIKKLKDYGFSRIRIVSIQSWKCYTDDSIRATFSGYLDKQKYIIKISKGFDDKLNNSIAFYKRFNGVFDFVPNGKEITIDGYKCLITEPIIFFEFYQIKKLLLKNQDVFIKQMIVVLNCFNNYKIIHRDFETYNWLFDKKTFKLYVIDYDTCYCERFNLGNFVVPKIHIQNVEGGAMFDDSYSLISILNENSFSQSNIQKIEEMVGRNYMISNQ